MTNYWRSYINDTSNPPPSEQLISAMRMLPMIRKRALDAGSCALGDSRYMLYQGFQHVTGLDSVVPAQDKLASMPPDRFTFIQSAFEDHAFPTAYFDLVSAQSMLPFMSPGSFSSAWQGIADTLAKGGILTCQLLGLRDEWNVPGSPKTFHSEAEARAMCGSFKILHWNERENPGTLSNGVAKYWHTFDIIALKL